MKDVVLDEEIIKKMFIIEKDYQEIKKKMHQKDDYYSIEKWKKLVEQLS